MPHQRPLSDYPDIIRRLKQCTNTSTSACRLIKYQIDEHFEPPAKLESQWAHHTSTYEDVVDDSRAAATRLSASINMYTSLQSAFTEAKPADVIHELATLRKAVSGFDDTYASRLDALLDAIGQSLRDPEIAQFSRRLSGERSAETSRAGWLGSTSSTLQAVGYHLLWTPLVYVGGLLSSGSVRTTAARKPASGVHGFNDDPSSPQEVIANIRHLMREIEKQKPLFAVFWKIAHQLIGEFDRYSAALDAQKDKPDNTEAIGRAHADVAARAGLWKELARVLVDEYARG